MPFSLSTAYPTPGALLPRCLARSLKGIPSFRTAQKGGSILCLSVGLIGSMIYLPENLGSLVLFNIFEDLPKDVILYSEIHTF